MAAGHRYRKPKTTNNILLVKEFELSDTWISPAVKVSKLPHIVVSAVYASIADELGINVIEVPDLRCRPSGCG